MKKGFLILIITLLGFPHLAAQNVVTSTENHNGTPLKIEMDSRVQQLMAQNEETCKNTLAEREREAERKKLEAQRKAELELSTPAKPKKELSIAEICRKTPRLGGYKIQVAVKKSTAEANEVRTEVRTKFPDLRTEVDGSLRPNYRVLAGSFFTKESGSADLQRVRRTYPSANLIPYRIFCLESK